MSKWDELEKAAIAARDMPKSVCIRVEDVEFREIATPEAVLPLIEQNREMLEALQEIYNEVDGNIEPIVRDLVNQCGRNRPTDPNEIYEYCGRIKAVIVDAIRKATGEE